MPLICCLGCSSLSCKVWADAVGYVFKGLEGRGLQDNRQKARAVFGACQALLGWPLVGKQPCPAAGHVLHRLRRCHSHVFRVPHSAELRKWMFAPHISLYSQYLYVRLYVCCLHLSL